MIIYQTKVKRSYSSWLEIVSGVLYLVHYCLTSSLQIFFFISNDVDIASYTDDNTPYVIADDINGVIASLQKASKTSFEWFENNLLKVMRTNAIY